MLGGGYAALPATVAVLEAQNNATGPPFGDPGIVRSIYNGGNTLSRILAMVVGIAGDGQRVPPQHPGRHLPGHPAPDPGAAGQGGDVGMFGLLYGATSVAAGVLVAIPFVGAHDGSFFLDRPATWRSLALGVGSIALWTMIGMGIGILIKNMLVAMLVGISFAYLIEPILSVIFFLRDWDLPLNLMPSGATNAMLGVTSPVLFAGDNPFPWWQGALVLAGWCLLPAIIGVLSTVRARCRLRCRLR